MLLERAKVLVRRTDEYRTKRALANEAERFATRARQLGAPTAKLAMLRALVREFLVAGVAVELPTESTEAIVFRAAELLKAFNADQKALLTSDEAFTRQFVPALDKLAQEYRNRLVVAWQARVDGSFSPLPESVLQAIATIPSYRGQVDAIRTKHLEVLRLRAELPVPNQVCATLERITAAVVAKDDAWRHLSGSGIPDEVIDFLRQAGTSGFSLAKLTPAIQAWLGERDLLGTFRIRSA